MDGEKRAASASIARTVRVEDVRAGDIANFGQLELSHANVGTQEILKTNEGNNSATDKKMRTTG